MMIMPMQLMYRILLKLIIYVNIMIYVKLDTALLADVFGKILR